MRLWMSGEIMGDVSDSHRILSLLIEGTVNECIRDKDYGHGLKGWAYIAIILDFENEGYGEVAKYRKRLKEVEFRLKIDHESFCKGGLVDQVRLMAESLLRSLRMMPEIGVKDVDFDGLTADVRRCLTEVQARVEAVAGLPELSVLVESGLEIEEEQLPPSWRFVQVCWPRGDFRVEEILRFFALMQPAFGLSTLYYRRGKPVELSAAALEKRFKGIMRREILPGYGASEDFFTVLPSQRGGNNVGFTITTGTQPGGKYIDMYNIDIGEAGKVPDRSHLKQSIEIFNPFEAYLSDSRNEAALRLHRRRQAIPDLRRPAMIAGFHYLDEVLARSVGGIDHCLKAPAWRASRFCKGVLFELTQGLFENDNREHRDVQRRVMEHLGIWEM
jgi:hypothetical protein